jgi:hypothetical protein
MTKTEIDAITEIETLFKREREIYVKLNELEIEQAFRRAMKYEIDAEIATDNAITERLNAECMAINIRRDVLEFPEQS